MGADDPAEPSAGTTTGLGRRTGAFLAYLAWWVTGALMLIVERRDRFVRFHAVQALAGLGSVWFLGAIAYALAFGLLSFNAAAFRSMFWVAHGVWAAGVGLWLVSLVKVFRGERWRMPLVARLADRLA